MKEEQFTEWLEHIDKQIALDEKANVKINNINIKFDKYLSLSQTQKVILFKKYKDRGINITFTTPNKAIRCRLNEFGSLEQVD